MSIALRNRDWEYRYFAYQAWQPDEVWCSLTSPEQFTAPQARRFFWQKAAKRILTDLQSLIDDGWQPVEAVGPDALKIRKSERIEFGIDPSDVFLWFLTLGV